MSIMHDKNDIDSEMEILLTPNGVVSRHEQDVIFDDVMKAVRKNDSSLNVKNSTKISSSFAGWIPLFFSGVSALFLIFAVQAPKESHNEYYSRGQSSLELRCNQEVSAFYLEGKHILSRCKGELEINISDQSAKNPMLALVSDKDDLRWISSEKKSKQKNEYRYRIKMQGDERILLINLGTKNNRQVQSKIWEQHLSSWKAESSTTALTLFFKENRKKKKEDSL